MTIGRTIILAVGLTLLAGCEHVFEPPKPFHIDSYLSSPGELDKINQVAFVELQFNEQVTPTVSAYSLAISRAVQDRRFTHMRMLEQSPELSDALNMSGQALSLEQLATARKLTGADAIMYGSITRMEQYPRMQVGLKLRMLDLRKGRLIWAIDHVWDTTDKAVEQRIETYFKANVRAGYEPLNSQLVLVSPKVFAGFVAQEVADTIPPKPAPVEANSGK